MSGFGLAHTKWVFYLQLEDPFPCHLDKFLTRLFYDRHLEESGDKFIFWVYMAISWEMGMMDMID